MPPSKKMVAAGTRASESWYIDPGSSVFVYAVSNKDAPKTGGKPPVPLALVPLSTSLRPTIKSQIDDMEKKAGWMLQDPDPRRPEAGREFSATVGRGVIVLIGNSNSPLYKTSAGSPRELPKQRRVQEQKDAVWMEFEGLFSAHQREEILDLVSDRDDGGGPRTLKSVKGISLAFVDGGHRGRAVQRLNDKLIECSPNLDQEPPWKFSRGSYFLLLPPVGAVKAIEDKLGKGTSTRHDELLVHHADMLNHKAAELNMQSGHAVHSRARSALLSARCKVESMWKIAFWFDLGEYSVKFFPPSSWKADAPELLAEFWRRVVEVDGEHKSVKRRRQSVDNPLRKAEAYSDDTYEKGKINPVGQKFGKIFKGTIIMIDNGDRVEHRCVTCDLPNLLTGMADTVGMECLLDDVPEERCNATWNKFREDLTLPVLVLPIISDAANDIAGMVSGWDGLDVVAKNIRTTNTADKRLQGSNYRSLRILAIQSSFHYGLDNAAQSLLLFMTTSVLAKSKYATSPKAIRFEGGFDYGMRNLVFGLEDDKQDVSPSYKACRVLKKGYCEVLDACIVLSGVRLFALQGMAGALGYLTPASLLNDYCRGQDKVPRDESNGEWAVRHLRLSFHGNPAKTLVDEKTSWDSAKQPVPTSAFDTVVDSGAAKDVLVSALDKDGYVAVLRKAHKRLAELAQTILSGGQDDAIERAFKSVAGRAKRGNTSTGDGTAPDEAAAARLKHHMPLFLLAGLGTEPLEFQTKGEHTLHNEVEKALARAWSAVSSEMTFDVARRNVRDGLRAWAFSIEATGTIFATSVLSGFDGLSSIFTDRTSSYKKQALEALKNATEKALVESKRKEAAAKKDALEKELERDREAQRAAADAARRKQKGI